MNPQIIIAAVIAATSFGAAWRIQDWRADAKEKAHAEQKLVEVQHAAAVQIRRADNIITAQNDATARAVGLRRDLSNSRSELDRLRAQLAATVPTGATPQATCVDRAATVSELFAQCAAELQELAGKADRHASDVKTLTDAWPK